MTTTERTIAIIVTAIWSVGMILSYVDHSFKMSPEASGIMLALVTGMFGSGIARVVRDAKNGNQELPPGDKKQEKQ